MAVTHAQLEEAKQYVNYGIKEGYLNESEFEDLTDEEFVAKAKKFMDQGEIDVDGCDNGGHYHPEVMAERLNV